MLASALALALTASPTLWLEVTLPESTCGAESLQAAIVALAPGLTVALGNRPQPGDLQVTLARTAGETVLKVSGAGEPLVRSLPDPGADCNQTIETAALMIDRYLEANHWSGAEPSVDQLQTGSTPFEPSPSRPSKARLWLAVGPTLLQAPAALTAGLALELGVRVGLFEIALGGEADLSQQAPVSSNAADGDFVIVPAAAWIVAGVVPPLGPGHLLFEASGGLSYTSVFVRTAVPVSQPGSSEAFDGYFGLRAGYSLDLPSDFTLTLYYEERFCPAPTRFTFEGFSNTVLVRAFSGELALLVGWFFF